MKDARIADVSRAHSLDAVLTLVELTWHSRRIENRIRFGRQAGQQILIVTDASLASPRAASFASSAGRPTTTAPSSLAPTSCVPSPPVRLIRHCRSSAPAVKVCCERRAGPRSSGCSRRSTLWKRSASIRPTSRQTTGGTFTTAYPSTRRHARTPTCVTKPGCSDARLAHDPPRRDARNSAFQQHDWHVGFRRSAEDSDLECQRQRTDRPLFPAGG